MKSAALYYADVAMSRGTLPNHRVVSALTSPTHFIVADSSERVPSPHFRNYSSMPHFNKYFQHNA